VTDLKVLEAPMERVSEIKVAGGAPSPVSSNAPNQESRQGGAQGSIFAIDNRAETALAVLRYRMKDAAIDAAEDGFEAGGHRFSRGSFIIRNASASDLNRVTTELGLMAYALPASPTVKTHPVRAARVALMHTWLSTQLDGWWRQALDSLGIPYDYISTEGAAKSDKLNAKYDVILFAPLGFGGDPLAIVRGVPMDWG